MTSRLNFKQEMSTILGSYSVERGVLLAAPRQLGDIPEEYVIGHENVHKVLVMGTRFGFFERIVGRASDHARQGGAKSLDQQISRVISDAIAKSFNVHEGTATYVELCVCADHGNDAYQHWLRLPESYQRAVKPLISLLGIPLPFSALESYRWCTAVLVAKMALNSNILRAFVDPNQLSPDSFSEYLRTESPDERFTEICGRLQTSGGFGPIVTMISKNWGIAWEAVLGSKPTYAVTVDGASVVDLKKLGGLWTRKGNLIAELAEHDVMRGMALLLPEMPINIGNEEFGLTSTLFLDGWREQLPPEGLPPKGHRVEVTAPGDERILSRTRTYAVRFRVSGIRTGLSQQKLDSFLKLQANRNLMVFAGFQETVDRQVVLFGASFSGFVRSNETNARQMRLEDSVVGVMSIEEILDFALLTWSKQPYANNTAWHLPLEVAHRHGFPNVAVGIHGALLRTWPLWDLKAVSQIARGVVSRKASVYIQLSNLTNPSEPRLLLNMDNFTLSEVDEASKALVIQVVDDRSDPFTRLPCRPDYVSWLCVHGDSKTLKAELENEKLVFWGSPPKDAETALLRVLLDVGYNLESSCVAPIFDGKLVPVRDPLGHD